METFLEEITYKNTKKYIYNNLKIRIIHKKDKIIIKTTKIDLK